MIPIGTFSEPGELSGTEADGFRRPPLCLKIHPVQKMYLWEPSERMSFCFGFRRPKGGSTLRYLNARGRQSRPSAKVFTCGENACTAHSRRRPEGRVGAVLSACREFENIQIVVTSHKVATI